VRFHSIVFTLLLIHISVSFFPAQNLKLYIPWKRWLDVAAKEELCIVDWIDSIMPPGPDFDIKGLDSGELRELVGPYIDAILEGHDSHGTFSMVRWSEGVWFDCCYNNTILTHHQSTALFPSLIQKRGSFPSL
jgi:hypothetical protein